jgi:hypothetical protein
LHTISSERGNCMPDMLFWIVAALAVVQEPLPL